MVIDGKVVMQGRQVLTLDEEAILADIRERCLVVGKRAGMNSGPRWPVV